VYGLWAVAVGHALAIPSAVGCGLYPFLAVGWGMGELGMGLIDGDFVATFHIINLIFVATFKILS
jgi:hypothetical protein